MDREVLLSGGDAEVNQQSDLEHRVAEVWREVFQSAALGRDDNFFELGGNSLLGMELTDLLASRFGIRVPVLTVFLYPSVGEMAAAIAAGEASE